VSIKEEGEKVSAIIQDNGSGFQLQSARDRGLGLVGMEERVKALAGKLTFSAALGSGTSVHIELPLAPDQAA
jgi:signal transduction histidine kinase